MAKGTNTAGHPNRQVGRDSAWSAAMDARTREYDRARSGQMGAEEASRVDINLSRVAGMQQLHGSISPRLGSFERRLRAAGH